MSGPKKAVIKKLDKRKIEILKETLKRLGYKIQVENKMDEIIIRGKNIAKDILDINVNQTDGKISLQIDDDTVTGTVSGANCDQTLQGLVKKLKQQDVEMEITDWGKKNRITPPDGLNTTSIGIEQQK